MNKKINLNYFLSAFCLLLCITSFEILHAQVTPENIAEMQLVTSATISSDGNSIAYTLSVPADPLKENKGSTSHLYILNNATGKSQLYFSSSSVSSVAYRPSKGTFTFLTKGANDDATSLYEISLGGGEASNILSPAKGILGYQWSADGNKLVYNTKVASDKPESPIAYKPDFFEEEMGTQKAYIVDFTAKSASEKMLNINGTVYLMSWSPDGKQLAVTSAPTAAVDDSYMKQQVMVVDATTGNVKNTINNQGKINGIEWSPDSKKLALNAGKDIHDPTPGRIMIVDAAGDNPTIIDDAFQGKYEHIIWTDAKNIFFHASESTSSLLGTISPDGTNKNIIFKGDNYDINSFSRSSNGTIALVASTPSHPYELFTIAASKKAALVKRTTSNDWLSSSKLGKQEVVRYKTRDGKYEIDGMLIYPLNYAEGTRVPLITVVHGGPEAHYSNGWLTHYSMPGQMGAANGYAVFYPNYRGSTGRGIDFIYSSQGDMAGKEFDDVVDGIDFLIEKGIADKNRIGVTGGSYGGYASAWMSTYYSDRFAAAVMFVGISNNISKWGTSDIPEEMFLVHERGRVWDDWDGFLKTSPIYYTDRSKTPILIMHGANDPRVHPAQSMELYRHIKVRKPDVPVRLIYYPGEGHGNRNSGSRYDYNLRMMQWFETYLKTGDAKAKMPALDLPGK